MPSRWAGFDDKVQGAVTFFKECLDSIKGDIFYFPLNWLPWTLVHCLLESVEFIPSNFHLASALHSQLSIFACNS